MRVLIVNTSEKTGGAAIAANRLLDALIAHGVKAKMLVRDKTTDNINVCPTPPSMLNRWRFVWERAVIWLHNRLSRQNLWTVDIANTGCDITRLPEFQEADVIHLHWVNQGFLSIGDLQKILASGKRIVWTMHDMWAMTAICHYSGDCMKFADRCHDCPQLVHPSSRDLSARLFQQKAALMSHARITFVGCSQWITGLARQSALLRGQHIVSIPNVIPHAIFHPADKQQARRAFGLPEQGRLILFGSQKVTNEIKGFRFLVEAMKQFQQEHSDTSLNPKTQNLKHQTPSLVVVGGQAEQTRALFSQPVYSIPYISDEHRMASLYAAVDVFVTPSLQDNLPNVIAEAMMCGVPCVGFNVGGIPEMITHQQDGYVARYRDAADLATGIRYVLSDEHHARLSAAALKASTRYLAEHVATQYIKEYETIPTA